MRGSYYSDGPDEGSSHSDPDEGHLYYIQMVNNLC